MRVLPIVVAAWCMALVLRAADLRGTILDASGAAITGLRLTLYDANGRAAAASVSGGEGQFLLTAPPGDYRLHAEGPEFERQVERVTVPRDSVRLVMKVASVATEVTVTATRGSVEDLASAPVLVDVAGREQLRDRPLATIGSSLTGKPGVMIQETGYGQVSPTLRGLTGYQTLLMVDGIRYNTGIFRSGPNQYLGWIDPESAERVEVTLGPAAAAYGSDSLGGTVNVMTDSAPIGGSGVHGSAGFMGTSADLGGRVHGRAILSRDRWSWLFGASGRRANDLRAGGGADSHNVFRRYFGLTTSQLQGILGSRLVDTGFGQDAGHTKLSFDSERQSLTLLYQYGTIQNLRNYRDLLGGLGRLQALLDPQTGHFAYLRYERRRLGPVDALTGTFSVNSQADGAIRRGTRFTDPQSVEYNRADVLGYAAQATTHAGRRSAQVYGAEWYGERVASTRWEGGVQTRAVFPNGSRYGLFGAFAQNATEMIRGRLRAVAGVRLTGTRFRSFADRNLDGGGRSLGVADSDQSFRDFTFHTSLTWQAERHIGFHVVTSRGFRAPNVSDLTRVGLNGGLGYEISSEQAAAAGALAGNTSGEGALPSGAQIRRLKAETLLNYEAGLTFQTGRVYARVQAFDAEFSDPITGRTVLFPADRVPSSIGNLAVVPVPPTPEQRAAGVIAVAPLGIDPRSMKTAVNDGRSRYYGLESLIEAKLSTRWMLDSGYSWMNGRDLNPNRTARRLPPQQGTLALRHVPSGRRPWFQISATAAGPQTRLAAGDIDDERIGASRRRSDISSFFASAIVSPYVSGGIFTPTGETLAQIRDRVLPVGATINGVRILNDNSRVPMLIRSAGWASLDVRGGIPIGERVHLTLGVCNLLDRNYRSHGSGIDSPGINAFAGLEFRF